MAARSGPGSRSRRPISSSRTSFCARRGVSVRRYRARRRINAATSAAGRFQLSAEKAYNVSAATPSSGAASTVRRTASAPARWPATRGRPRRVAQRPLPSITIATCREELCGIKCILKKNASPLTGGVNQRFHVVQVALQRAPPGSGEPILGLRNPPLERLRASDVLRLLEPARVHAQLPSVVLSRALSWLKLNDSLTASALTMPRRTRSWISRSSSAAREPPRSLLSPCSTASVFRAAPCLATVPPSDDHAEPDVQAAEPRSHEPVAPRRRPEQRRGAHQHEAESHHGDDPDRERATRHEPRAVQEQPGAGQRVPQAGAVQHDGEQD